MITIDKNTGIEIFILRVFLMEYTWIGKPFKTKIIANNLYDATRFLCKYHHYDKSAIADGRLKISDIQIQKKEVQF